MQPLPSHPDSPPRRKPARTRRTPLAARGDPAVWLMSLALLVCVVMIAVLVGVIAFQGMKTFWPAPIHRVTLNGGETFLGMPVSEEAYDATLSLQRELDTLRAAGTLPAGATDSKGRPVRRLYRVGNRDIGQEPFRWVSRHSIATLERPADAVLVEREAWSVWLGTIQAVVLVDDLGQDAQLLPPRDVNTDLGPGVATREHARNPAGIQTTLERTRIPVANLSTPISRLHDQARDRRHQIESLTRHQLGAINTRIERLRLDLRAAQRRLDSSDQPSRPATLPLPAWLAVLAGTFALPAVALILSRRATTSSTPAGSIAPGPAAAPARAADPLRARLPVCLTIAALPLLVAAILLNPWARRPITPEQFERLSAASSPRESALRADYAAADARRLELEADDSRYRVELIEPRTGRFAPRSFSEPNQPLPISSIVRIVPANTLSFADKFGVYASRWREFLTADPRAENTEGGVYPVIFGTVLLTLLLTAVVVPLGVIAAIYIREYARQGILISIIRVAINNLAGVPSIVYGVFGLGFFCYTLGRYIDTGPTNPLPPASGLLAWWPLLILTTLIAAAGAALGLLSSPPPGSPRRSRRRALASSALWLLCTALVITLLATSPYFGGFFADKAPNPTFGTRGLLWGALTLALLTLPVVIVATEEAIAAVPRSMREGSHACGATTWQTIRSIVLPGAMPGILTGAILAMARGAGEVAPLMLVGAVKQTSALPLDADPPFLHADRSFLHLGFHIYDLGSQSPDSQAARPLVWTTTLLLLLVVLTMNLAAVLLRARLRARAVSSAT